jgi:hypothetical protein
VNVAGAQADAAYKPVSDHRAMPSRAGRRRQARRVSAAGGVTTKLRLLNIEGAQMGDAPTLLERRPLAARPRRG